MKSQSQLKAKPQIFLLNKSNDLIVLHVQLLLKESDGIVISRLSDISKQNLPFINDLLLLLVWLNKPLANANKATVHETTFQQVVNGFKQECSTLIGQAAFPLTILLT